MDSSRRYSRVNLPEALRDTLTWPAVDVDALSTTEREIFGARQRAVSAYLEKHPLKSIWRNTRIGKSEVVRFLNRCIAAHPDGRIYGWRALLPWQHTRPYRRLTSGNGLAGKFA